MKPSGVVLYSGKSLLNGEKIACIMSIVKSKNSKTGNMIQTWILADNGITPLVNAQSGADSAICGDCIHRGEDGKLGSCYVNLAWAPNQIYKTFQAGKYPIYNPAIHNGWIKNRVFRFGSYGDPAAVPYALQSKLARLCPYHTGYTHAWRYCDQRLKRFLMASVDTEQDYQDAKAKGWRTFRARTGDQPLLKGEITCPASQEGGKTRTCATCKACHGAGTGRDIAIVVHGWPYKLKRYARKVEEKAQRQLIGLPLAV